MCTYTHLFMLGFINPILSELEDRVLIGHCLVKILSLILVYFVGMSGLSELTTKVPPVLPFILKIARFVNNSILTQDYFIQK